MAKEYVPYSGPIVTRDEALALGLNRYFTGSPCVNGHLSQRNIHRQCIDCNRITQAKTTTEQRSRYNKIFYAKNQEEQKARAQEWRKANPDKQKAATTAWREANKERHQAMTAAWANANKEYRAEYRKRKYAENKERENALAREYKEKNKKAICKQAIKRTGERLRSDLNFKILYGLRGRMNMALAASGKPGKKAGSTIKDLGCSIEFFKEYIAAMFEPWMTWENRGRDTWHLDHVIPLASFDLTKREQFLRAAHYTNHQPMRAEDNRKKRDSLGHVPKFLL